ncbi:MAG: hypothetical protein ACI9OJ_003085 [Myxococcota bacterium]|jgi:hypothetical protein
MKQLTIVSAAWLSLLLVGCPEHEPTVLTAQGALFPEGASCEFQAQTGGSVSTLSSGILDMSVARTGYIAGIQLLNGLASTQETTGLDPSQGVLETNFVNLIGVTVNYEMPSGLSVDLPEVFHYTPNSFGPTQAGVAVVNLLPISHLEMLFDDPFFTTTKPMNDTLLEECFKDAAGTPQTWGPAPIGSQFATILVRMVFEGMLLDGTEVRSNEFVYPIQLCTGCLLARANEDAQVLLPALFAGEVMCVDGARCALGQDFCQEYSFCAATHQSIIFDSAGSGLSNYATQITACIDDPNFANALIPNPVPVCGLWSETQAPGSIPASIYSAKYNQMACRLLVSRLNAYCSIFRKLPWEP